MNIIIPKPSLKCNIVISVVVFAPQIVSLVRSDQSSAVILFETPQTGLNPEFFEVLYYVADGTTSFDQVML